jgi:uncharacterized membrane protein YdjX (TVP38/TMEM64 family)
MRNDYLKIIGLFLIIFAVANVLVYSLTFQETFAGFIAGLEAGLRGNDLIAPVIFILLAALSVMLSPFSVVPFTITAIGIWGKGVTLLYVMVGSLLGASTAYVIGAQAIHRLMKWVFPAKKIEKYSAVINDKSSFLLIELFFLAMPAEVPGYVLGAGKYTYWKFILAAAMAYLPFEILVIYAGEAFLRKNVLVLGVFMTVFAILFCVALFTFQKKIKRGPIG